MVIISSESRITSLVGASVHSKSTLKFSPFLYKVKIGDEVMITNTFTRFFAVASEKEAEVISPNASVPSNWIANLTEKEFEDLADNRIFLDDSVNEFQTYLDTYGMLDHLLRGRTKFDRYNILTTTGCNARCYYCFEDGYYSKPEHMSLDTAEKVSDYILRTHDDNKKIYIRWFGGEPLVNLKVIDYISNRLNNNRVDFYSTMSTNGLLCSKKVIEKALSSWRMSKIRITLDGWGDDHNSRKNFHGVNDAFSIILDNIDAIVKAGIIMVVRLTIDSHNFESLLRLTNYLVEKYQGFNNFMMYSHCLHEDISRKTLENNPILFNKVNEYNDRLTNMLMEAHVYDYERLQPDGFRMYLCAAQDPTKISITPSGGLCRCECLSNDEVTWGKVGGEIDNKDIYAYWHDNINNCREQCKDCILLPLCTPYSICPLSFIHCKRRFERNLNFHMKEKYRRWKAGEEQISLIDCLPIDIKFE